jgi:hypothetical protein
MLALGKARECAKEIYLYGAGWTEKGRTRAKSFASWPPVLMAGD